MLYIAGDYMFCREKNFFEKICVWKILYINEG